MKIILHEVISNAAESFTSFTQTTGVQSRKRTSIFQPRPSPLKHGDFEIQKNDMAFFRRPINVASSNLLWCKDLTQNTNLDMFEEVDRPG